MGSDSRSQNSSSYARFTPIVQVLQTELLSNRLEDCQSESEGDRAESKYSNCFFLQLRLAVCLTHLLDETSIRSPAGKAPVNASPEAHRSPASASPSIERKYKPAKPLKASKQVLDAR